MHNTFTGFRQDMDKETLQLMWCEFITAMAEDNNECHSTMKGMLDGGFDLAIVQLCGMTPTDLYHQVLARQENAS